MEIVQRIKSGFDVRYMGFTGGNYEAIFIKEKFEYSTEIIFTLPLQQDYPVGQFTLNTGETSIEITALLQF